LSLSTLCVTTTTKLFKSSSPIGLSYYYFFCGFNICLLLENSPRFGAEYPVETTEKVKECEELIVEGLGYDRDRRGIETHARATITTKPSEVVVLNYSKPKTTSQTARYAVISNL